MFILRCLQSTSKHYYSSMAQVSSIAEQYSSMCKALERRYEKELEQNVPYVIRLDGVNFKRLTKSLKKPFDPFFTAAMLRVGKVLLSNFHANTVFVQSDEVSVFFDGTSGPIPYNGRCLKIASISAGMASAAFNQAFSGDLACFDARVFACPTSIQMAQVALWRHLHDCRRNAVNSAGVSSFPHAELQNIGLPELVEKLRAEKGIDFHTAYPPEAIYGAFIKRALYIKQGYNPKTGEHVPTERYAIEARSIDFAKIEGGLAAQEAQMEAMLMAKHWTSEHPLGCNIQLD